MSISLESSSSINNLSSVSVEHCPFTISLFKGLLESFSNAVDIFTVNLGSNLEVVVTKDNLLIVCREKCCSILLSCDSEVEWRLSVFEGDC